MKKILLVLSLIIVVGLSGCDTAPSTYNDTELQTQIADINTQLDELSNYNDDELQLKYTELQSALDTFLDSYIEYVEYDDRDLLIEDVELQTQITDLDLALIELQNRLDNLTSAPGLNGIISYYENTDTEAELDTQLLLLQSTIIILKDTLDKSKCPDYLLDIEGNYVSFEQLGALLKMKYFDNSVVDEDIFLVGFQAKMDMTLTTELSNEEVIARTILLIQELQEYKFYIISCPEVYLRIIINTSDFEVKIPLATMLADFLTITVDGFYDEDYEIKVNYITYDKVLVQQYYDEYVASEQFNNYVLNYVK